MEYLLNIILYIVFYEHQADLQEPEAHVNIQPNFVELQEPEAHLNFQPNIVELQEPEAHVNI